MKLSRLLSEIGLHYPSRARNPEITSITSDHRQCVPGALFVAIRGAKIDGHTFLRDAEAQGASALVGEDFVTSEKYLRVPDSRLALSELAAALNAWPSQSLIVIGVTGTSGKTTTTYLLESIFQAAGKKVGVIGTVNFRIAGKTVPSTHTTPGPAELQKLLVEMKAAGCEVVVMEVSSHALKQRRVSGVLFDAVAFSNLTPEHLDYHPDIEDYYQSKKLLFTEQAERSGRRGKNTLLCVNSEDSFGARLAKDLLASQRKVVTYEVPPAPAWTADRLGVRGSVQGVPFHSNLAGRFNASNIQCAISLAIALKIDPAVIARGIEALPFVPGRMQAVPNSGSLSIWVDYAHKPDALEKVLQNLQAERKTGRLWTVVGCGGDRDRSKRPVMAEIAERLSDRIVVTSDNPRTEKPEAILQEICQGFTRKDSHQVEADRKTAIFMAIHAMKAGDFLVIAGKGHEAYQIVGQETLPFDDVQVAAQALAERPQS